MGIFSLSDIVIAATLLVNAIALMSSRTYKLTSSTSASSGSASASASAYGTTSADPYESAQEETEPLNREAEEPEGHEQGLDKDSDEGEGDERGRGRGSRAIIRSREGEGREGLGREDRENREGREDRGRGRSESLLHAAQRGAQSQLPHRIVERILRSLDAGRIQELRGGDRDRGRDRIWDRDRGWDRGWLGQNHDQRHVQQRRGALRPHKNIFEIR